MPKPTASHNHFEIQARDGLWLRGTSTTPKDRVPRAHGVLVHGFAEHRGRYDEIVAALCDAGWAIHAYDLRGHGESEGRRGHVADFGHYADDLDLVFTEEVVPRILAGEPAPFLIAHSLGGLIALDRLLRPSAPAISSLVLSSPYLAPAFSISPLALPFAALADRLHPGLDVPSGLDAHGLSRDPRVVADYMADEAVYSHVSPRWFLEVEAAQHRVEAGVDALAPPCLLLLGAADPIAAPARSEALFASRRGGYTEIRTYPAFLHEVLNEIGRERVVEDLLAWLDGTVGSATGRGR